MVIVNIYSQRDVDFGKNQKGSVIVVQCTGCLSFDMVLISNTIREGLRKYGNFRCYCWEN